MRYREEIPYPTEVGIVEFKERERKMVYFGDITVERDTQKQTHRKGASSPEKPWKVLG